MMSINVCYVWMDGPSLIFMSLEKWVRYLVIFT